jgi:antitoxin VapB
MPQLTPAYAGHMLDMCKLCEPVKMKSPQTAKRRRKVPKSPQAKSMSPSVSRRASIFRNGANQAVRLPQELRFSDEVKEVRIRRQGDALLISPIKPNWATFFSLAMDVPEDFLGHRDGSPPQSRDPL